MKLNKYILEIIVFSCGVIVMIFELVGSRILGPYFGTSIFIWTSLIGIILGSLSLGYYLGGKIADNNPSYKNLSKIIILSAISIGITILLKDFWIIALKSIILDSRFSSVIVSIILFSPTSIFLGMVSPYAVKLKITNLDTSASTVGNLSAISTFGSIVGTFFAGFYLIPHFGTNKLLIILLLLLITLSLVTYFKEKYKFRLISIFFLIIILTLINNLNFVSAQNKTIDVDTTYNRIWIYDSLDKKTGKHVKVMGINNENHSSMFLDDDNLVNEYTKFNDLASHFNKDFKKTLMLGGAGYSYPKYFLSKYPNATMDVIEIDPKVTELARKYFRLKEDSRLNIFHVDGRVFLNETKEKYDVIFGDAFSSHYSLPYQLTTKEAVLKKFDILNPEGIVIVNVISGIEGDSGQFLRAEYATYKSVFPQVYVFPVSDINDGKKVQNIIIVALKNTIKPDFKNIDNDINRYLSHLWSKPIDLDMPILTDDFAPVDFYINKNI